MNDIVAYESLSKYGATSEVGARRALALAHAPVAAPASVLLGSRAAGDLRNAHVGTGFAKLRLDLERAWRSVMRLDCREALAIAELIEQRAHTLSANVAQALRCEIAALRAVACVFQDDEAAALPAALSACGPDAGLPTAHVALTVCRSVYWRLGDLKRFHAVERITLDDHPRRIRAASVLFDLALDAAVALDQMHFRAARLLADQALENGRRFAGKHAQADALPACIMAQALHEQGQVDEAEALLVARMDNIRECCTVESALRAHGLLARIAASRGQFGRARVILNEAEALGERRGWLRLRAASLAQQVEIEAGSGRNEQAGSGLRRLAELANDARATSANVSFEIARFHTVARARVALVCTPCTVDIVSLQQIHRATLRRGGFYAAVPIALLLVEALLVTEQRAAALELLVGLLRLAPGVGLYQTFMDCSARVADLIEEIVQQRLAPLSEVRELLPYAGMLLMHRRRGTRDTTGSAAARRQHAGAGLSERERLIVAMMGRGLSNKQIAAELRIAPETVKSHAKHLYTKLSVRNRTEAVTLATRLGLLQPPRSLAV